MEERSRSPMLNALLRGRAANSHMGRERDRRAPKTDSSPLPCRARS
jgi:hypothetical protein